MQSAHSPIQGSGHARLLGASNIRLIHSKGKVLLILPWIATSTNEVNFHVGPAFPSPASEALPGTHDSWVGWSNVREVSCSGKHN